MSDLISRQAAIDAMAELQGSTSSKGVLKGISKAWKRIEQLPPIQPTIQPEPHWIPVTEKLPEYGTEVVTYNRDEEFEINHIIDEEDGEWFLNGAIAWMPLPEPNKGVTE